MKALRLVVHERKALESTGGLCEIVWLSLSLSLNLSPFLLLVLDPLRMQAHPPLSSHTRPKIIALLSNPTNEARAARILRSERLTVEARKSCIEVLFRREVDESAIRARDQENRRDAGDAGDVACPRGRLTGVRLWQRLIEEAP